LLQTAPTAKILNKKIIEKTKILPFRAPVGENFKCSVTIALTQISFFIKNLKLHLWFGIFK
jgi:hypothetical protein